MLAVDFMTYSQYVECSESITQIHGATWLDRCTYSLKSQFDIDHTTIVRMKHGGNSKIFMSVRWSRRVPMTHPSIEFSNLLVFLWVAHRQKRLTHLFWYLCHRPHFMPTKNAITWWLFDGKNLPPTSATGFSVRD